MHLWRLVTNDPMWQCLTCHMSVTCRIFVPCLPQWRLGDFKQTFLNPFISIHIYLGHQSQNASQYARELKMIPNWAFVKLRSRSRSGEGQLQVRWGSGRLESGPSHVNQSYIYLFFLPPSTHPLETFFFGFLRGLDKSYGLRLFPSSQLRS